MSAGYWTEQDKKTLGAPSPTIPPSLSWDNPDHEEKDDADQPKNVESNGLEEVVSGPC